MSRDHHCHANGCHRIVPPRMLMCKQHWAMVPKDVQDLVWKFYRPGQEKDKNPSKDYLCAANLAIMNVSVLEMLKKTKKITPREMLKSQLQAQGLTLMPDGEIKNDQGSVGRLIGFVAGPDRMIVYKIKTFYSANIINIEIKPSE